MKTHKEIWAEFCATHCIAAQSVPLFEMSENGFVATKIIGTDSPRPVLKRSAEMERLVIAETAKLIADWRAGSGRYDGLIYLMFTIGGGKEVIPLYIGKAETVGKGDRNLSANLANLSYDKSKFARWGDNYAYHIGDLSAACLPGHPERKRLQKYCSWASALFEETPTEKPQLRFPVRFWATAWSSDLVGVWQTFGPTKLAFLEYLLIGVASSAYPHTLLNREGRNR